MRKESVRHGRRVGFIRWRCGRHLELALVIVAQSQSHDGHIFGRRDPDHSRKFGRKRVDDIVDETGHLTRRCKRKTDRGDRHGSIQAHHLQRHTIVRVGRVGNRQPGSDRSRLIGRSRQFDVDPECRSRRKGGHASFRNGLATGGERENDEARGRGVSTVRGRTHGPTGYPARRIRRNDPIRGTRRLIRRKAHAATRSARGTRRGTRRYALGVRNTPGHTPVHQARGFTHCRPGNRAMSASVEWSSAWCSMAKAARCASVVKLPPPPTALRRSNRMSA